MNNFLKYLWFLIHPKWKPISLQNAWDMQDREICLVTFESQTLPGQQQIRIYYGHKGRTFLETLK